MAEPIVPTDELIVTRADEMAVEAGARWDHERGEHFVETVENNFRLYEGTRFSGELVKLMPWQREFFMRMFCWVVWSDFLSMWIRRFRRVRLWVPKKNGKSPMAAMVGLYLVVADGEKGGKTYSAAKDGKQAAIVHDHAIKMVEQSPELSEECTINKTSKRITHGPTLSWYGVIAGDNVDGQEGLNGNSIIDEAHVVDARLAGVLEYMGASRDEPIDFAVSTAGSNLLGWGRQQWDYGEQVNKGEVDDLRFLHQVFSAPQDATDEQLSDPRTWAQANPSLGEIINPEVFETELKAARRSVSTWQRFKMYRFNIWGGASAPWLNMSEWQNATHNHSIDDFAGEASYLGLDMSLTRDMTGATLIVPVAREDYDGEPDHEEAKHYYMFSLLWITQAAVERWGDVVPFAEWSQKGFLRIIPGPKIHFRTVRNDIASQFGKTDVQCLTYDPTYAVETAEKLSEELGCTQIEFRQSLMEYAEPTQIFERMLSMGLLRHPDNEALNWQAGHVEVTHPDRSGNYRPVKPQSSDKGDSREAHKTIDGIQAGVMAIREAKKFRFYGSYYEDGEVEMY
ncbi:MAG: terminase TerL endonuclease subunit [Planctomycetota bacterium]